MMVPEPRVRSSHLAILFRLLVVVLSMCQQNWGPVRGVGEALSLPLTCVFRTLGGGWEGQLCESPARESRGSLAGAAPHAGA